MNLNELATAYDDTEMQNLVSYAIAKKAAAIVDEATPSNARLSWAQQSLQNPATYAQAIWRYLVGTNHAANLDAVLRSNGDPATPTDATIESNVNAAVDKFWP